MNNNNNNISVSTNIYAIVDVVASSMQSMFMSVNDAMAIRNFDYVSKQNPMVPSVDLELYCIGSVDLSTCAVTPLATRKFIKRGE